MLTLRGRSLSSVFLCWIFFSFFTLQAPLTAQDEEEESGFLGIDIVAHWHGGTSDIDGSSVANNVFGLQLVWLGAANFYEITTYLHLISDLIHVSDQYNGLSDYLSQGEVDYFSYFSLNIQYSLWHNDHFRILFGYGLGHLGYLSTDFSTNPYTIFIAPVFSSWWFISDHFGMFFETDLPIGTYRRNSSSLWHFRFKNEIIFEPKGTIANPEPSSVFLSLGWQFDYIYIVTREITRTANVIMLRPYFRLTYLY